MTNFDLALLPTLEALLRERSVSRAAKRMGRSQPALSRDLARLREQLGDPILIRTRAGTEPTHRAQEIAEAVFRAADELRRALHADTSFSPDTTTATFRVSLGDYETSVLLPQVLARLCTEAPKARIAVLHRRRPEAEQSLATGEIGLAIGRFEKPDPLLHGTVLFKDGFAVCVRQDLAERIATDANQLPFVLVSPGGAGDFDGLYDRAIARKGQTRVVVASLPYFLAAIPMLLRADVATVLPRRLAEAAAASAPITFLPPPRNLASFEISALWHQRTHDDPAYRWLRRIIVEEAVKLAVGRRAEPT